MIRKFILVLAICLFQVLAVAAPERAQAQAAFGDDRVMLQGFYWESYRHGHGDPNDSRKKHFVRFGSKRWYEIVRDMAPAIRAARFDLIWLPPTANTGHTSAGYDPREYFNIGNSFGNEQLHREMLVALLNNGVEPVADIVINHRDGSGGWCSFKNPDWGVSAIARTDEAFSNPKSECHGTPIADRGAPEEKPVEYTSHGGTAYEYDAFRDIDHTNPQVRRDIIRYLKMLQSYGYRGWRYDMVHGFHAKRLATYNRATNPTFSVGEYDWDKHGEQRGWMWHTATEPGNLRTASSVFDFSTMFTLKDNKGKYSAWYGVGNGIGMVGDTTDGHAWKNKAVTFLENHDTGFRTNEDNTPQKDHKFDSFANNWEVEQAYAQILTQPGVPSVYWKHYFDWGSDLQNKIRALINARKVAGVHAGSAVDFQDNARARGVYAARVHGRNGDLYVRIGGGDEHWQPSHSGYADYREYARGAGWKVWVGLPGNPPFQQAPMRGPLPVPEPKDPATITVSDALLN